MHSRAHVHIIPLTSARCWHGGCVVAYAFLSVFKSIPEAL